MIRTIPEENCFTLRFKLRLITENYVSDENNPHCKVTVSNKLVYNLKGEFF